MDRLWRIARPLAAAASTVALGLGLGGWIIRAPASLPAIAEVPLGSFRPVTCCSDELLPSRLGCPPVDAAWLPPLNSALGSPHGRPAEFRQSEAESSAIAPSHPRQITPPEDASRLRDERPAEVETPPAPLPAETPQRQRSQSVEFAAREADAHVRKGFELASLGASYSAQEEFVAALRRLAQALDAARRTHAHSQALADGLAAIRESGEFVASGQRLEADLDLAAIVAGHRTPVLKHVDAAQLTPRVAMGSYFTFAQEQLAMAAGEEVAGSMALYSLGKLYAAWTASGSDAVPAARPKAMTFYQAALLACPRNYIASHDLGVLLAQGGRTEDARVALDHSLSIRSQPIGWHNLAAVQKRLGKDEQAQRSERAWAAASEAQPRDERSSEILPPVRWLEPDAFARPAEERFPAMPITSVDRPAHAELCGATSESAPPPPAPRPLEPAAQGGNWSGRNGFEAARASFWRAYCEGQIAEPACAASSSEYRLREGDQIGVIYRRTREEVASPYRLNVGDEVAVESAADRELARRAVVQPDGTVSLRLVGQVYAQGKSVPQLAGELDVAYQKYYRAPRITVATVKADSKLEAFLADVRRETAEGKPQPMARVAPDGTVSLPALGSIPAQGLTLAQLQTELGLRYREQFAGLEATPVLVERAPEYICLAGDVRKPGRYPLSGPTTLMQAVGIAGGWCPRADLSQVAVFRPCGCGLSATLIDLANHAACAHGSMLLSDGDIIVVPRDRLVGRDELLRQVFSQRSAGVAPLTPRRFAGLASL